MMDFFTYSTPMFLAALVEIIKMLENCGIVEQLC